MVDEPPVFGPSQHYFTVAIIFGLPNQGRSFGNENGKHPSKLGIGRAKFFGLGVLGFVADSKVTQRDSMLASIGMHAPGKVPRQLRSRCSLSAVLGKSRFHQVNLLDSLGLGFFLGPKEISTAKSGIFPIG